MLFVIWFWLLLYFFFSLLNASSEPRFSLPVQTLLAIAGILWLVFKEKSHCGCTRWQHPWLDRETASALITFRTVRTVHHWALMSAWPLFLSSMKFHKIMAFQGNLVIAQHRQVTWQLKEEKEYFDVSLLKTRNRLIQNVPTATPVKSWAQG